MSPPQTTADASIGPVCSRTAVREFLLIVAVTIILIVPGCGKRILQPGTPAAGDFLLRPFAPLGTGFATSRLRRFFAVQNDFGFDRFADRAYTSFTCYRLSDTRMFHVGAMEGRNVRGQTEACSVIRSRFWCVLVVCLTC